MKKSYDPLKVHRAELDLQNVWVDCERVLNKMSSIEEAVKSFSSSNVELVNGVVTNLQKILEHIDILDDVFKLRKS